MKTTAVEFIHDTGKYRIRVTSKECLLYRNGALIFTANRATTAEEVSHMAEDFGEAMLGAVAPWDVFIHLYNLLCDLHNFLGANHHAINEKLA